MSRVEVGDQQLIFSIGHDVTLQVDAVLALAAAEAKYRTLVERIPETIWTMAEDGMVTFMTPNAMCGYTAAEMTAEPIAARLASIHEDDRAMVTEAYARFIATGATFDVEYRRAHKDGHWVWVRNRALSRYERDGTRYIEGMISDVTERKRLEQSLHQAQKMEAVGQLTGGIAHDFNNILAAILANACFLLEGFGERDPRRDDVVEIKESAERAAALIRQLLALSRRQVLEPTVADLDMTIRNLEKMLRRIIGEDIDFNVVAGAQLGAVRVDVGQIEQVIMNVVVNARDAMPAGGKLTIETANVDLNDPSAADRVGALPGDYVRIAVSDTGCGMDEATRSRIFEPFFTTKEVGKGTGLGLPTCHGIVKQSGGCIWVDSAPGRGSVFEIYLPRFDALPAEAPQLPVMHQARGEETVLLIEDDERVRLAIERMLRARGYRLLIARDGREAIEIAARHAGPIHLVLSDVIMPGANGPEVVQHLKQSAPSARVLFMSGYTDHPVLRDESLQTGMRFIQKPFAPEALSKKVRELLDTDRI